MPGDHRNIARYVLPKLWQSPAKQFRNTMTPQLHDDQIGDLMQSRIGGWSKLQPFNRSQLSSWLGRPMLW